MTEGNYIRLRFEAENLKEYEKISARIKSLLQDSEKKGLELQLITRCYNSGASIGTYYFHSKNNRYTNYEEKMKDLFKGCLGEKKIFIQVIKPHTLEAKV